MLLKPLQLLPAALMFIDFTGAQAELCASPTVYTTTMCSEVTMTISQTSSAVFAANMSSAATSGPVQTDTPSNLVPALRGQKNMLYFGKWDIYQGYKPQGLPVDRLTHILYAFADVGSDGSIIVQEDNSDTNYRFEGDSNENSGTNAYGCVKQLFLHKTANRHLKTLISIGGWASSHEGSFTVAAATKETRQRFAESAVTLLADWGFDGLDIDWEYPQDAKEAHNFVELLAACRRALDAYAAEHGQDYRYLLTVAASAGSQHYSKLNLAALDGYVDSWHLMAYDYAGSWDNTAGHQANLYADTAIEASTTKFSTHLAVSDYIEAGVHPQKIVLGLPLYGRSFINTEGLGHPFTGVGNGTIEQGVWLYRDLPLQTSNAVVQVDEQLAAAYTYDSGTRELISFDNVETALLKARYIRENGLGGAFFWEAAGDKTGDESLIATLAGEMLGSMDDSPNMLDYPASRYVNIKDGMREGV